MPVVVDHEKTRARIAELAVDVIAHEGLNAVTMRRMAEAAHTSRALVSTYFANMHDLILAVFIAVSDRQATRMIDAEAAGLGVAGCVEALLPLDADRLRDWRVTIAYLGVSATDPELAEIRRSRIDGAVVRFEQYLVAERGLARPSALTRREARRIVTAVTGAAIEICLDTVPHPTHAPHPTPAARRKIVDAILGGCLLER